MKWRTLASACLVSALAVSGLSTAAAAAQVPTSDTPCGVAPVGYNVIVSDAPEIQGTSGKDYICAGDSANVILGLGGDDHIFGEGGDDLIEGGPGNDIVRAGAGKDTVFGGVGDDTISGGSQADELHGNRGHDIVNGGSGSDDLRGGKDGDTLKGGSGSDDLRGGQGRDTLYGESGSDELWGERGSDVLRGGTESDILRGNKGDDKVAGGFGDDRALGGTGFDRCSADTELECEDVLADIGIKSIDRDSIVPSFAYLGEYTESNGSFSRNSTVTIYHWASTERNQLIRTATIATDNVGQFWYFDNDQFPVGSYLEVLDDESGQQVEIEITLNLDRFGKYPSNFTGVQSVGTFLELTSTPNTEVRYDSIRDLYGDVEPEISGTMTTNANGVFKGSIVTQKNGRNHTTLTVVQGPRAVETIEFRNKPADLWVSQFSVGSNYGSWTPDSSVRIERDGIVVAAQIETDYRGRFGYAFTDPLTTGTTVTVTDLTTGDVESLVYEVDIELISYQPSLQATVSGTLGEDPAIPPRFIGFTVDALGNVRRLEWRSAGTTAWIADDLQPDLAVLAIGGFNEQTNHEIFYFL